MKSAGLDKEYAPISGILEFSKLAILLALGEDNVQLKNGQVINLVLKL